ncbi:uncharacterized protein LOC128093342 [Culex pipiens pallens]|uniref:uncharacterized protein LOC128093342 n=1 Tax=Culex pipiens pallens TaxID=42434 RepID=UPI0022AAAAE6|nr:uncharacterized protein LOC128093342 [Culex pipiens pallens]
MISLEDYNKKASLSRFPVLGEVGAGGGGPADITKVLKLEKTIEQCVLWEVFGKPSRRGSDQHQQHPYETGKLTHVTVNMRIWRRALDIGTSPAHFRPRHPYEWTCTAGNDLLRTICCKPKPSA